MSAFSSCPETPAATLPGWRSARPGAALVLALLLLVVLDCIVLGTLHLALQEHRIGSNRADALRLRIVAENAIREGLGFWSGAVDSMASGSPGRMLLQTGAAAARVERLGEHLFLIAAEAREPAPRVGRAAARLLVHPPALPRDIDAAPAPLSANGRVHVLASGIVTAQAAPECTPPARAASSILTRSPFDVVADAGALLDGAPGLSGPRQILTVLDRLIALSRHHRVLSVSTDTVLSSDATGVLVIDGSLTIAAGVHIRGLIVARGSISIEPGSAVTGAVHAGSDAVVAGTVQWSPCAVADAVSAARLTLPRAAGRRAWVPAF
jgi:hypothetical protein